MSVNLCMISGSVISKPKSIGSTTKFKINSVYNNKNYSQSTDIVVSIYGQHKDACLNLEPGHKVYVEGKIKYLNKVLPNGKKQYWTEIVSKEVMRMGS